MTDFSNQHGGPASAALSVSTQEPPPSSERRGIDWLFFITMVNVILLSGAVQYFNIFFLAAINVLLHFFLLWRVRFVFSKKVKSAFVVVLIYLLYSILLNSDGNGLVFIVYRFHDILTALLLLNYLILRKSDFQRTFSAVLIFFVMHGFINWAVVTAFFPLFSGVAHIKAEQLFYVFFGMSEQYLGIHRSQGMFWEPGVYQIYLNVALHFFLFYDRRLSWAVISFIGVILTMSTTGVVIAGIQVIHAALSWRMSVARKLLFIIALLPGLVIYADFANTVVVDKLTGERSGSFLARSFDTRNGIALALEYPLGIGFDPARYQQFARENVFNIDTPLDTDRGQTNGVLILTYSTGFLWAIAFLISTFRQRIFLEHRVLFFAVLVGSMVTEPLTYSPFFFFFVLSGLVDFKPIFRNR